MGQVMSYTNGIPVLVVTAYGALMLVHRSGLRWDMASGLFFLSMFGWAAGVIPAIVDATIRVNVVMHNTMWVPGHFHFYLLLGLLPMFFGFMYYLAKTHDIGQNTVIDKISYWAYSVGGLGFVLLFLYSGKESVPRRWAQHLPEWFGYNQLASAFATLVVIAAAIFALRFISRVPRMGARLGST
jgi:cytochrome c oxidase subunit 1